MTPAVEAARAPPSATTSEYDQLFDTLVRLMNTLHEADFSERFWGILLYRYLCKVMRVHQGLLPLPARPTYIDHDDAILERKVSEPGDEAPATSTGHHVRGLLKTGVRTLQALPLVRRLTADRKSNPATDAALVTGFHDYDVILRRVAQPATKLRVQKGNWRPFGAPAKRRKLATLCEAAHNPLAKLALDWLPAAYVEEFEAIHGGTEVPRVSRAQIHASFLSSIETRMAVAKHVEAGASLNIYQHSAGYGEVKGHLLYHAESSLADRFMTWGWQLKASDSPYLALRLMQASRRAARAEPDPAAPWIYVVGRQPTPTNVAVTLSIQRRLFPALTDATARNIIVRPRTNKGGSWRLQVSEEAQSRARGVDDGRSSASLAAKSAGLLILDTFPTTSFMECLVSGNPVIAIVPPGVAFTDIANVFYDEMFAVGLLHRTPRSAADFLNQVVVERWWREVRDLDWLREYRRTFCNCDETRVAA